MKIRFLCALSFILLMANTQADSEIVTDNVIVKQREALQYNTDSKGYGPQSPRNIDQKNGKNTRNFSLATQLKKMNLCNIHFHKGAEHKGGEFTHYNGNGDGSGYQSGYAYSGDLSVKEKTVTNKAICATEHSSIQSGDTIEVHYVYSSAKVQPGPSLGACLNDAISNPQLRVEAQVYVLVNDDSAASFANLTHYEQSKSGYYQANNIPSDTGLPVLYAGSTTGPGYNEKGSPFQVTWSVRPKIKKVNIDTLGAWCSNNSFNENHAHGVRNLITNTALLSEISE